LNTLIFNETIKELSLKYNMQDIDVIDLLVASAIEIFNSPIQILIKENLVYMVKVSNNKKISLNSNTLKRLSSLFDDKLKLTGKRVKINLAKKLLKNKTVILFEVIKKLDNEYLCTFSEIIAFLPFSNIPNVDLETYTVGSKHYGVIYSYSYKDEKVILNCKHNDVELEKIKSTIFNVKITRVNRYYGKRVKVYGLDIPNKAIINNLKMIYPNEKIIFFRDKNV
jgi:hypothetical protein